MEHPIILAQATDLWSFSVGSPAINLPIWDHLGMVKISALKIVMLGGRPKIAMSKIGRAIHQSWVD